jgi:D-arabinose 1-dehydrogenase-like Zn-dependent alcohol dehydrogenase
VFVAVGLPPTSEGNFSINPWELVGKDAVVASSAVGTVQDMRDLIALASAGRVRSHISRRAKLSELESVFDDLQAGRYVGRAVLTDLAN